MGRKKDLKKKPRKVRHAFKCLHGKTGMSGQVN